MNKMHILIKNRKKKKRSEINNISSVSWVGSNPGKSK